MTAVEPRVRSDVPGAAGVRLEHVSKASAHVRPRRRVVRGADGRGFVDSRAQRHRQERDAAAHRRPGAPDAGSVFVDGEDVPAPDAAASWRACAQRIGFLFQNAALFDSISVGENVAFPLRRHTKLSDAEIRSARAGEAGGRRPRARVRQDAGGAVGRHAQARRAGARDGARPADAAGGRAERRARSDHRRRDRCAAARSAEAGAKTTLDRRHPQHAERAQAWRSAAGASRRAHHRRGSPKSSNAATTRSYAPS